MRDSGIESSKNGVASTVAYRVDIVGLRELHLFFIYIFFNNGHLEWYKTILYISLERHLVHRDLGMPTGPVSQSMPSLGCIESLSCVMCSTVRYKTRVYYYLYGMVPLQR